MISTTRAHRRNDRVIIFPARFEFAVCSQREEERFPVHEKRRENVIKNFTFML